MDGDHFLCLPQLREKGTAPFAERRGEAVGWAGWGPAVGELMSPSPMHHVEAETYRPTPQLANRAPSCHHGGEAHVDGLSRHCLCLAIPNILLCLRSVRCLSSSPATVMMVITKAAQPHTHGFTCPNNDAATMPEICSVPVSLP